MIQTASRMRVQDTVIMMKRMITAIWIMAQPDVSGAFEIQEYLDKDGSKPFLLVESTVTV